MKKLKKLIALFTAALFCILPLISQPLTAQASTPTTYYLRYIGSEWRFLPNVTSWDENGFHRELYYMHQDIKDGDIIIIDGPEPLNLGVNVSLSNLTILNSTLAIVQAKSYDEVYVSNGSSAAINGNVNKSIVFDGCAVNFNNDIQDLRVEGNSSVNVLGNAKNITVYDPADPVAYIECNGTVEHVKAINNSYTYYDLYSFAKGTLKIENGSMMTDAANYSKTAPAVATTPAAPSQKPAAGELDDVPKTGNTAVSPVWFLGLAVVCLMGYRRLERR